MNSAKYVDEKIAQMKSEGMTLRDAAWKAALLCVGWPYVYAGRGEKCTPANRRARYSSAHPTIKTKCKNFDGKGSCDGCKWFPKKERVLFFDCRGFPYWLLLKVYGWKLNGDGATSQWNNKANWKAKGTISTIPDDKLVCLFVQDKSNKSKMSHTGLGYKGETCECSSGVQHFTKRNKKWTHWGLPACEDGNIQTPPEPTPTPTPEKKKPTIRRGSSGKYVKECQNDLISLGYDVGKTGADGKFGKNTEKAVKEFQKAKKLAVDGIVGAKTWAALDKAITNKG
ncbi:MAG: peptidoglycan-binding protein [Clostridia bacterium]|nr:peptidoglycan-binding protein [Clostridia bacterium]